MAKKHPQTRAGGYDRKTLRAADLSASTLSPRVPSETPSPSRMRSYGEGQAAPAAGRPSKAARSFSSQPYSAGAGDET